MKPWRHLTEAEAALHAGGDLPAWQAVLASLHLVSCPACRSRLKGYAHARRVVAAEAQDLPAGLDWDALAAEMTANIHLGLTAGALVRRAEPDPEPATAPQRWQALAVCASLLLVAASTWMLQRPTDLPNPATIQAVFELPSGSLQTSVDFDGGERGRQLDAETGQLTITQVYAD
jgi:hypothetical protein